MCTVHGSCGVLCRAGRRIGARAGRQLLYGAGYYFAVPLRVLLLAAAVGYAVSGVLLRGDALHGPLRREVERLTICIDGREREVAVLHDTGNGLSEPVSGHPVVVMERAAAGLLEGRAPHGMARRASLVRCHSRPGAPAGLGCCRTARSAPRIGLLLYFRPDSVYRADGNALDCVCAVGPANRTGRVRRTHRCVKGREA